MVINRNEVLKELQEQMKSSTFSVIYDPNKKKAEVGDILIGMGDGEAGEGVTLNNKITRSPSVAQFIHDNDQTVIQKWRNQGTPMEEMTIYIEDLSPDTIFSFLLFYAFTKGSTSDGVIKEWVDYCNRWKRGDVKTTGQPFRSWGNLVSSLGHDFIGFHEKKIDSYKFQQGFENCVRFTLGILLEEMHPHDVQPMQQLEEYHRAQAIVQKNKQEYRRILTSSERVQLQVPLKESQREILVDSIIITEEADSPASLKVFLRNDTENTWLNSGFGLMAVHQPSAKGTGNDMVIAVDPSLGIDLKRLWERLEQLENEKWENKRPTDTPRYLDGRSEANEPWFDEFGKCTIIAAPRKVGQEYGSKLEWSDVEHALWEVYNPLTDLVVQSYPLQGNDENVCKIDQCVAADNEGGKRLYGVKWKSFGNKHSLFLSPTFKRYLAACIVSEQSNEQVSISDLPSAKSFDYLELPGGFAVINYKGVFLFDDWSKDGFEYSVYEKEYRLLLERLTTIHSVKHDMEEELKEIHQLIDSPKRIHKELIRVNSRLADYKIKLRSTILKTMSNSQDFHIQRFREHVEKHWALHTQLDELYETVDQLDNIVKGFVETRTGDLMNKITIFGFPLAVGSGAFAFIVKDLFEASGVSLWVASLLAGGLIGGWMLLLVKSPQLKK